MKEHKINELNNFIAGWYISTKVCNDLIKYFRKSKQQVGMVGNYVVDPQSKKSTDVLIDTAIKNKKIDNYLSELAAVIEAYKVKYPYCDKLHGSWSMGRGFNIQRYLPGEAFYLWHCEVTNRRNCDRHLVAMTYLNTIKGEGGETVWYHQNLKIKPEKGLTVVWPTTWMFTHKGIPTKSENKMITTVYYTYMD